MLPLAALTVQDFARVVGTVLGGVAIIQDIYCLSPQQEGILHN